MDSQRTQRVGEARQRALSPLRVKTESRQVKSSPLPPRSLHSWLPEHIRVLK